MKKVIKLMPLKDIINFKIITMEQKEVLKHHAVMLQIKNQIKGYALNGKEPGDLINEIIMRNNDQEFAYMVKVWQDCLRRAKTQGFLAKASRLPTALQVALLARAKQGKFADVLQYIQVSPFDDSLHVAFWLACCDNREIIATYVSQYPLEDVVLRKFWNRADTTLKCVYLVAHEVSKDIATEMWTAIHELQTSMEWAKVYLAKHAVPEGFVADLLEEDPVWIEGILDLIEFSSKPFSSVDEVALVRKLKKPDDIFVYISKFGLGSDGQVALLQSGKGELIRRYIDAGNSFAYEAQVYMLSPEFLRYQGNKDLLVYYLQELREPFDQGLLERLNLMFE